MLYFIILLCLLYSLFFILAYVGFKKKKGKIQNIVIDKKSYFSILIPARNEEQNIIKCLHSISQQKDFNGLYEIIIIDDFSEDNTKILANDFFQKNNINGKVISLSDYLSKEERLNSYKKKAIEIGIELAHYEWILQTDADCLVSEYWLMEFQKVANSEDIDFIVGSVSMEPPHLHKKHSILYTFQAIDFMTMQGITAATHFYKIGLMCNGANLGYRKKTFFEIEGFKNIDEIASGDDMLLLQKYHKQNPSGIHYLLNENSIVQTSTQETWYDFLQQRIRWSSKSNHYPDKRLTIILAIVYLFNLMIFSTIIYAIFDSEYLKMALYLLSFKVIIEFILVVPVARFFKKKSILLWYPILQPLHIIYIISAGFLGKFGKYQWKNRTVK